MISVPIAAPGPHSFIQTWTSFEKVSEGGSMGIQWCAVLPAIDASSRESLITMQCEDEIDDELINHTGTDWSNRSLIGGAQPHAWGWHKRAWVRVA